MKKASTNKSRATITDVAKLAGVSVATAARVFDKKWDGKVSDSMRQKVLTAAASLKYYGADAFGSTLSSGHSNIVALVVGAKTGYYYLEVLMTFVRKLGESGRQVMIFEANPSEGMEQILRQVRKFRVDAMIVTAAATTSSIIEDLSHIEMPIIMFNRRSKDGNISAVYSDGNAASKKVATYLIKSGHQNLAIITGNANLSKETERIDGFIQQAEVLGGKIMAIKTGDYLYESGYQLALEILSECRPDAIYCAEDTIAMGAIDACRSKNYRVPADISVFGFDNISIGRVAGYELTSIDHPTNAMIEKTIELVDLLIKNPDLKREYIFDMEIVERGSVSKRQPN